VIKSIYECDGAQAQAW